MSDAAVTLLPDAGYDWLCLRCLHQWRSRKPNSPKPIACASCHSSYWSVPPKAKPVRVASVQPSKSKKKTVRTARRPVDHDVPPNVRSWPVYMPPVEPHPLLELPPHLMRSSSPIPPPFPVQFREPEPNVPDIEPQPENAIRRPIELPVEPVEPIEPESVELVTVESNQDQDQTHVHAHAIQD